MKQGYGEAFSAFGRGVKKGAVGLVTGAKDVAVGTYYGTKTLVTDPGTYFEDVTTVYSNLPTAVVESAKHTIQEIQDDPTKISEMGGSFAFDLASFVLLDKGAGKIVTVVNDIRVLRRLERITETAVDFVDADVKNLTSLLKGKELRQFRRGQMVEALRGKAIERMGRQMVKDDAWLMEQVDIGAVNRGPDVLRKGSNQWYDWTTTEQWSKHEMKYQSRFGQGNHLNTDR